MKKYITALCLISYCSLSMGQITFNGCHYLLDDQDFIFSLVAIDVTGRNVYETIPIDGNQPCSGIGACELRIAWNDALSRWELLADDGTGDFSAPFLIYSNNSASTPNPPSLNLGTWVENTGVTSSNCGGDLTNANTTLTGDVQDNITLGTNVLTFDNSIKIYPNPTQSILSVSSTLSKIQEIQFYSISGNKVLSVNSKFESINTAQLSPSIYLLKIINSDGFIAYKKMIIK